MKQQMMNILISVLLACGFYAQSSSDTDNFLSMQLQRDFVVNDNSGGTYMWNIGYGQNIVHQGDYFGFFEAGVSRFFCYSYSHWDQSS